MTCSLQKTGSQISTLLAQATVYQGASNEPPDRILSQTNNPFSLKVQFVSLGHANSQSRKEPRRSDTALGTLAFRNPPPLALQERRRPA